MDQKAEFELLKELCLSDGGRLLLEDVKKNKNASDTIMVMPIVDDVTKQVLSPATDEMFKRIGYVQALNWLIGVMEHYQTAQYEEIEDEI